MDIKIKTIASSEEQNKRQVFLKTICQAQFQIMKS